METNYYNRSNNFSAPIRKEPKPYAPKPVHTEKECQENECPPPAKTEKKDRTGMLSSLQNDDLLILGLIFLLINESNEDTLLILALGYLLLSSRIK
ncbi:MAG: hypothetical protein IKL09_06795 [Clostridia bacterium]|nr:hypothetical protein [Clostridia bacterium]